MTEITKGLITKIERATQSAQIQIKRSVTIDEIHERTNPMNLSVAISAGASKNSTEFAYVASEILKNTTMVSNAILPNSTEISSSMRPPIISTYEISDMTMTPFAAPTPIIPSLFSTREIDKVGKS